MEKKHCPYCGEEIMATAKKCHHCGEWLNDDNLVGTNKQKTNIADRLQTSISYFIASQAKKFKFRISHRRQPVRRYHQATPKVRIY